MTNQIARRLPLNSWTLRYALFALWLAVHSAWAATLVGRVVGVTDGDTLTVLDQRNVQHKIRLAGIDAPERRQPYYDAARQYLSKLTFGKEIRVEWYKRSYKRLVGNVYIGGEDVGLEVVRAGLAWHYKAFEHEQTPQARTQYTQAEGSARAAHRGLWRDPRPTPPWEYRHREKTVRKVQSRI